MKETGRAPGPKRITASKLTALWMLVLTTTVSAATLRLISADYEGLWPPGGEAAVEAYKQREQAERGRKRPRRSADRSGR